MSIELAQQWLDFAAANAEKLVTVCSVIVAGIFTIALLIRAQLKLWRADAAGISVVEAVHRSGSAPAVKSIMRNAEPRLKQTVKAWLKKMRD